MNYPVVMVRWRDCERYDEQHVIEDDYDVSEIQSVGYLLSESQSRLVISRDLMSKDDARGSLVILRETVLHVQRLKMPEAEVKTSAGLMARAARVGGMGD